MGRPVSEKADVFTLAEWRSQVEAGHFNEHDGSGCWVKDNTHMTDHLFDDVFSDPPDGCTHVVWFNK
jgi:hypothetical protein